MTGEPFVGCYELGGDKPPYESGGDEPLPYGGFFGRFSRKGLPRLRLAMTRGGGLRDNKTRMNQSDEKRRAPSE